MSDSDENLIVSESGPLDFRKAQVAGPSQDHGFHESCFPFFYAGPHRAHNPRRRF